MNSSEHVPEWNLDEIYPGIESDRYLHAKEKVASMIESLGATLTHGICPTDPEAFAGWLFSILKELDELESTANTLSAYAYARFCTNTENAGALAELNRIEALLVPLATIQVQFRDLLAAHENAVRNAVEKSPPLRNYAFVLDEALFFQKHQMKAELEDLAADLSRSGADAWSRLQEAILANASALWDSGMAERKTMVELRNLAYDPERSVRQKAYKLELELWKNYEIPLAAALNGVKGTVITLNTRRRWTDALQASLAQARISKATIEALIEVMESSLPMWHRFLHAKANLLGLEKLSFYDLFAPLKAGNSPMPTFEWNRAKSFIVQHFGTFDKAMAQFAEQAFERGWIDARPRAGKVGGAFCTHFPSAKQARVLCNFDGSYSSLITIAHELGHAWHYETIKDMPAMLSRYPMTLAETASIFSETLVANAAMQGLSSEAKLPLIEMHLQDSCQVIVDILSRFYFEREVFNERGKSEITPARFCEIMLDAQAKTYGDSLRESERHPYMWAAKGHYYIPGLSFYNFPYAFGLLFGLGLYSLFLKEGDSFAARYRDLLLHSGSESAAEIARRAGFNLETTKFWQDAMLPLEREVEFLEAHARNVAQ